MRTLGMAAALGLSLALAAPALAQFGPPPPPVPQKGPAAVWNDQVWQTHAPVFSADLGVGGVGGFTGVLDPKTNQLCYMLSAPGVEAATAARSTAAAPPREPLRQPRRGGSIFAIIAQRNDGKIG